MNDTRVPIHVWRLTIIILILSIAIPILIAIGITVQGSIAAQNTLWTGFDDQWSINSGSIAGNQWQVQILSNSIGLAVRPMDRSAFSFQARISTSDPHAATGLLINVQDQNNFLAFLISSDGYMSLREMRSGGWIDREAWHEWPHIKREGQPNVLRIDCTSSGCAFFVNDEVTLQENNLSVGTSIGLIAYSPMFDPAPAGVTFDHVAAQAFIDR